VIIPSHRGAFAVKQPLTFPPKTEIRLDDLNSAYTGNLSGKKEAQKELAENTEALADLGYRLYAENRRALLVILQGMDTSGKDGTIRHAMKGFNPQSCRVTAFKTPTAEELDHDFLWRIHRKTPGRGEVGIFNRSHYEDVLIVRVHNLVPREEWRSRYERINAFEQLLRDDGIKIVKIFLHISKEEQRKRLQARLDDPKKRWKFRRADIDERRLWDDYVRAYDEALTRCNTPHAPWYIVPADKKWYRNLVVSRVLRHALEEMDPQIPPPEKDLDGMVVE
jgi:PPK2 family polyphosphate:nucleotide phosphotransferase